MVCPFLKIKAVRLAHVVLYDFRPEPSAAEIGLAVHIHIHRLAIEGACKIQLASVVYSLRVGYDLGGRLHQGAESLA